MRCCFRDRLFLQTNKRTQIHLVDPSPFDFFTLFSVAVEKRYAMLTFFLEDALQLAIQLYVLLVARQGFTTVTAFTLGGTMVGASMAAYRASKLVAYAIL